MKQTLIKIVLLTPFLFFNPNYGVNNKATESEDEPIQLQIMKLSLEHCNQQIMNVESEITYRLFLKEFKENEKN